MQLISKLFAIFLFFGSIGCISHKSKEGEPKDYKTEAFLKYGTDTVYMEAPGNMYILCYKKNGEAHVNPNILIEFFIFDNIKKTIVFEDKVMGASFEWKSKSELIISEQRGIIESKQDKGKLKYLLDLKTKEKKLMEPVSLMDYQEP
jgi:hypothetical protein